MTDQTIRDEQLKLRGQSIDRCLATIADDIDRIEQSIQTYWDEWNLEQKANAYIRLRSLNDEIEGQRKKMTALRDKIGKDWLPKAMEEQEVTTFTTKSGFRVNEQQRTFASIKQGMKSDAYVWLRVNNLGELIQETVSSSTLAATAKSLMEEGKELPDELFNVSVQPVISVTKTK